MSDRRHCTCLFEKTSGPPVQYCSHHAMQRKEIERLTSERNYYKERHSRSVDYVQELEARVEELEAALRIVPGFVTNRARAEFVRDKLAATEQEKLPWTDKDGNTQSSTLYGSGAAATEQDDEIERLQARVEELERSIEIRDNGARRQKARVEELETRLKLANDYVESLVAMINK